MLLGLIVAGRVPSMPEHKDASEPLTAQASAPSQNDTNASNTTNQGRTSHAEAAVKRDGAIDAVASKASSRATFSVVLLRCRPERVSPGGEVHVEFMGWRGDTGAEDMPWPLFVSTRCLFANRTSRVEEYQPRGVMALSGKRPLSSIDGSGHQTYNVLQATQAQSVRCRVPLHARPGQVPVGLVLNGTAVTTPGVEITVLGPNSSAVGSVNDTLMDVRQHADVAVQL